MTTKISKKQRAELRKLRDLAWERELGAELRVLREQIDTWETGAITAFAVTDAIHEFHDRKARRLHNLYTASAVPAVPAAVARGVLDESELSGQLLELLRDEIEYFREQRGSRPD